MRNYTNGIAIALSACAVIVGSVSAPVARAQAGGTPQSGSQAAKQPSYTMPEYNAFTACQAEKDPTAQVKCLDDFTARFPGSTLQQYVFQLQIKDYASLKNYAKEIEVADKLIAMDSADVATRLQAVQARLQAFSASYDPKNPDTAALTKNRDAALLGPKLLAQVAKPANLTDDQWAQGKKTAIAFFDNQAGFDDLQSKDYPSAIAAFKDVLANSPTDATATYELGSAYLAMNPPQSLDGFWQVARAIDLKVQSSDQVKTYLRSKILAYEQPGCDSQVDEQMNDMLQLAANSPDRPATYTLPTADDLTKIRSSSNILTVIGDLSGGGDKAKMTWLAICGSEFPEVVGKIIDTKPGDGFVDFLVYTGNSSEDMQAATTPNMDVKVYTSMPANPPAPPAGAPAGTAAPQITPQPDVARLSKDDGIQFAGTIVSYDPSPFLLHWDQVKVDPSIIPAEKGKPAGKKPAPRGSRGGN